MECYWIQQVDMTMILTMEGYLGMRKDILMEFTKIVKLMWRVWIELKGF
jgi:hypothetical protein